jgi:hypothetical protein
VPTPENLVLKAVCNYLVLQERLGKCVFWRQNNGATYDPKRKAFRKRIGPGAKDGVPDVALILNGGRFVAVECKSSSGSLSLEQKTLKTALEAVGVVYIVARGVNDLESLFARLQPSSTAQPAGD